MGEDNAHDARSENIVEPVVPTAICFKVHLSRLKPEFIEIPFEHLMAPDDGTPSSEKYVSDKDARVIIRTFINKAIRSILDNP